MSSGSMPALSSSLDANRLRNTRIRSRGDSSPLSKTSNRCLTPTCFSIRSTTCSLVEGGRWVGKGRKRGTFRWYTFPGLYARSWRTRGTCRDDHLRKLSLGSSNVLLEGQKYVKNLQRETGNLYSVLRSETRPRSSKRLADPHFFRVFSRKRVVTT